MSKYIIEVTNLSKKIKDKTILTDLNLSLQGPEIIGLIGVNGAGKTSFIKIMLDLLKADKGSIKIFGQDSTHTEARRNIAYLPEKFAPSQFLKGTEFLQLACKQYGVKFVLNEAIEIAAILDLDIDALHKKIKTYSKGMGQKLGLIAILLSRKPLYLLDEPMSGLDPHVRIRLKDKLREVSKEGKNIFFSSHILSDMEEICTKIICLQQQKFIFCGKPQDFMTKFSGDSLERAFLNAINK